ncbi:MAG: hypothetical protein WC061_07780, partial [Melioribacteraceae bacterium]
MQGKKFHFSASFVGRLIELTEGKISAVYFEDVLSKLEDESSKYFFDSISEANLLRITASIYDRTFFFRELMKYPHHGEILIALCGSSNYLTDIVVRNPEYIYQIFDQDYLSFRPAYGALMKELDGTEKFRSLKAKTNFLRQFKKRNILRIGLADILGLYDLVAITEQLSALAKSVITKLFDICYIEILSKYKISLPERKYCLCSLGKLGGNELNYSSDVDLILFFDSDEIKTPVEKDYREILAEAALLFIKSSTEITDHGYIYRIDFRLRPDGKHSPLCNSLGNYTRYYETRGEDWERQMLIKLDYVCGDRDLFSQFRNFIEPFVYPSTLSDSVKDKIREMKRSIERQNNEIENVKTFQGGIRDIEFTVQALQLLNGGKIKSLRCSNTLKSIASLTEQKLLEQGEEEILSEAYIFYRRIEHFLQLMNDRQTHAIPAQKEYLQKICTYLNLDSIEEFKKRLFFFRHRVRSIYDEVLSQSNSARENSFGKIVFKNRTRAAANIAYLRTGRGIINRKEFDSRTIELFGAIEPALCDYLMRSADPDRVLDNFVKVIRGTKFPSIWFNEFSNRKSFRLFLNICLYSQRAVDSISTGMQAEELFLSKKVFMRNPEEIAENPMSDIVLALSVQYSLRLINAERVSLILSSVIKTKISSIFELYVCSTEYFIGGMGSFGSVNMGFSSDVDLIIVVKEIESNSGIQKEFQQLMLKVNEAIKPFTADLKLRPEGNKSQLAWGIINYREYLRKRARIWEFQSLSKLVF